MPVVGAHVGIKLPSGVDGFVVSSHVPVWFIFKVSESPVILSLKIILCSPALRLSFPAAYIAFDTMSLAPILEPAILPSNNTSLFNEIIFNTAEKLIAPPLALELISEKEL